jgi:hypothetical protein
VLLRSMSPDRMSVATKPAIIPFSAFPIIRPSRRLSFPARLGRVSGSRSSLLFRHFFRSRPSTQSAQLDGGGRFALVFGGRHIIGDLAGRKPHDVDGVADYVGGAALAFGASGHYLWPRF